MTGREYAFASHVQLAETEAPYPTNDELTEAARIDERRRDRARRARRTIRGIRHDDDH